MTDLTPEQQLRVAQLIWPGRRLLKMDHGVVEDYMPGNHRKRWDAIDLTSNESVGAMLLWLKAWHAEKEPSMERSKFFRAMMGDIASARNVSRYLALCVLEVADDD